MNISKRLQIALRYMKGYHCLADVGSDHAHLAIAAARQYGMKSYAIDNKQGPYEKALINVNKEGLSHQITCLLQDGLTSCPNDADIIAICGMGGLLMKDILCQHDQSHDIIIHDLILQPNNHIPEVRSWLMHHQYQIVHETIIEERGKTYEIIYARYCSNSVQYSKEELLFGPILMKEKNEIFKRKYTSKLTLKQKALLEMSITNKSDTTSIVDEISLIERVLYEN
jgi:tRNA (adenine22-N1)-methyltransferase